MRRMITDNQLNNLKAANLKIIELDTSITNATITQEQMDIMFPKDAQGNIHKPDYDIIISDTDESCIFRINQLSEEMYFENNKYKSGC